VQQGLPQKHLYLAARLSFVVAIPCNAQEQNALPVVTPKSLHFYVVCGWALANLMN